MATNILAASGIYAIVNKVNGKRYVGSAKRLRYRFAEHVRLLQKGLHHSPTLQRAWEKYGPDAFEYVTLEIVDDLSILVEREQHWIDISKCVGKCGYNISPTAGSPLGVKHTEVARANMSRGAIGKKLSAEHRAKIAASNRGRVTSEETKAKRMATRMAGGSYHSASALAKIDAAKRGVPRSEETKEKLRAALLGRVMPEETKQKIRVANTGKKMSPEAIEKTASAHRGKVLTQETRDRIRKSLVGRKPSQEEIDKMAAIKRSPEARANARAKQLGKRLSPESIAKREATKRANRIAKQALQG